MADPEFPRGGGANPPTGHEHTILPNFPKSCLKLKEFGPGGHEERAPLDPPMQGDLINIEIFYLSHPGVIEKFLIYTNIEISPCSSDLPTKTNNYVLSNYW